MSSVNELWTRECVLDDKHVLSEDLFKNHAYIIIAHQGRFQIDRQIMHTFNGTEQVNVYETKFFDAMVYGGPNTCKLVCILRW